MAKKFYITTAIPYVNAPPHIGHTLEFVQADAIARYHELLGEETMFFDLSYLEKITSPEILDPKVGTAPAEVDISDMVSSPGDLPIDWRIEFEERAAILEYDGGLSREEADVQALQEIAERIRDAESI